MMELDPRIERLLNRRLDGELTAEEELELNKALIRCPAARAWLEAQARQDELVRAVLRSEIGEAQQVSLQVAAAGAVEGEPKRGRRFGWSGAWSGLLAASLLLAFSLWQPTVRRAVSPRGGQPNMAGNLLLPAAAVAGDEFRALPAHLSLPQREQQAVDRNFVGVYDEATQQYYVIELRNVRTQTVLVRGDM